MFDRFNAYVPIRADLSMNLSSSFGRHSYVINSIAGENVEINGKIENSIIFSNVKIDRNAQIKNSLILPGNHIGPHAQIVNSIIDEFSGDNTVPNIESNSHIGSESPLAVNENYPQILNFGVTLIGKDVRILSGSRIGGNCYIDSFIPQTKMRECRKLPDGKSVLREKETLPE
jgi:ADP-glucose pyrophosphorylase